MKSLRFCLPLFARFQTKQLLKLRMEMQPQKSETIVSSTCTASGISNDTITKLPSGLIGKEEEINGQKLFSIQEGKAKVYFPSSSPEQVFYNPVQEFNRDISIATIQQFIDNGGSSHLNRNDSGDNSDRDSIRVLEALSATGLRSIRYAKEISGLTEIVANDISKRAVASIESNIKANNVSDKVTASHSDASMVMYNSRKRENRFDIVDLDPYGSPTPFLDGAVQALTEGGLLCVTCTDLAVLAGNSPETCYTKYGAISLKS